MQELDGCTKLSMLTYGEMDKLTSQFSDQQIAKQFEGATKNKVGYYRRKLQVKSYGEKNNIQVGVKGVSNPTNRKHFFDEDFFKVIDSEIKAYALGLFFTDGSIDKSLHRARLFLTEADSSVLYQIAKAAKLEDGLVVTKPPKNNYQVHNMIYLNFNSSRLTQDLVKLGLVNGKENNIELPKIDKELECHFFRGMMDGDGHIVSTKSLLRNGFSAGIAGRKPLLENLNNLFVQHGFKPAYLREMKSIHELRFSLSHLPILDWCYGCNPSIAIPRKLNNYLSVKECRQFLES